LRYRKTLIEEFKAEQERHSVILSSLIKELWQFGFCRISFVILDLILYHAGW
jgi:hypothetical protein